MPQTETLPVRAHRLVTDVAARLSWLPLTLTRVALGVVSVPLAFTMVVAIVTAKRGEVADPSDLFALPELLYFLLFGTLAAFGAGPLSLDRLLVRLTARGETEEPAAGAVALGAR